MGLGGRLAQAYGTATAGAEEIRRKREAEAQAKEMSAIQRAALLAGLQEQGIMRAEDAPRAPTSTNVTPIRGGPAMPPIKISPVSNQPDYDQVTPLGNSGYVQDNSMTKRAQMISTQRQRQQMLSRRVALIRAKNPNISPDEAMAFAESDDAFEAQVKPQQPDKPDVVNWQTVEAPDGYYQVNPQSGEKRSLDLKAPPKQNQNQYRDMSAMSSLRQQFNSEPIVKNAQDIAQSLSRIRQASRIPSAAGDLALIFSYMKMLDPGSTVREGEFANAQNAAGVPDQLRNLYNRAANGERLNPKQRQDFIRQAEESAVGQQRLLKGMIQRYSDIASRNGFDPRDIVADPFAFNEGLPFPH